MHFEKKQLVLSSPAHHPRKHEAGHPSPRPATPPLSSSSGPRSLRRLSFLTHVSPFAGSPHSGEMFGAAPVFNDNMLPSPSQVSAPGQSESCRRCRHSPSCLSSVCPHRYFIATAPLQMFLRTPRNAVSSKPGGHVATGLPLPAPSAFNHFLKHFLLSASLTPLPGFLSSVSSATCLYLSPLILPQRSVLCLVFLWPTWKSLGASGIFLVPRSLGLAIVYIC